MRKFHQQFSNIYALRKELSWTHYRSLLRVENLKARELYMNEAANNGWSTRILDEQVDKHYYERLIATHKEVLNELRNGKTTTCNICTILLSLFKAYFSLNSGAIRLEIGYKIKKIISKNLYKLLFTHSLAENEGLYYFHGRNYREKYNKKTPFWHTTRKYKTFC